VAQAGLKYGLATGNWGVKTSRVRQGVAQVLNRMTYVATLSHLRRINTPIEKTGKLVQPRKLHATQWGVVCPSETPEGASVGLVKNMALLTNITVAMPSEPIHRVLDELGMLRFGGGFSDTSSNVGVDSDGTATSVSATLSALSIFETVPCPARVFVNGDLVGAHADPAELCKRLRHLKRRGAISVFTSVAWAVVGREVLVCTEGGRFVRPVLVVDPETGLPAIDAMPELVAKASAGRAEWHELVLSGALEYLDGDEADGAVIAMTRAHLAENRRLLRHTTHLEISPCAMLGVVAGSIPYSDHNQVNWGAAECVEEGGRALRTLPPPRRILLTQTYEGYDAS